MTRYICERRELFGVEPICRTLGVPVEHLLRAQIRSPSRHSLEDRRLITEIDAARSGYRRVYGVRKTWKEPAVGAWRLAATASPG